MQNKKRRTAAGVKADTKRTAAKKRPAPKRREPVKTADIFELIRGVLPHLCIIMSGMFIVFFFIECVNSHQGFLSNEFHKYLIFALSVCCAAESMILIAYNRRMARAKEKRRLEELKALKAKRAQR